MGIVAGRAGEATAAFEKALRLAQPISGTIDLKLVVMAGSRRMIEMNQVVAEGFSGSKRVHSAAESPYRLGQVTTRGLEMTLLTDIHLSFRAQSGWIDNRLSNCLDRLSATSQRDMLGTGAVAALAVDAERQAFGEAHKVGS